MSEPAAHFEAVTKVYSGWFGRRKVEAVRGVTLRIETGEVFGLLGPNRAGKTTLIKLLLSLSKATSGSIHRLGRPLSDRSTLARIGYMHENHAFPRYLTATELLNFYGALALQQAEELQKSVPALLERVGLADRSKEPISQFSKGMVQRLGLAQALIGRPHLLVLDEPTEGLDLEGRRLLREVVSELRDEGRTVLLVSHVLTEVEHLCDRVGVLVNGRVVATRPLQDLVRDSRNGSARSLEDALHSLYEEVSP
ncbi:MAG: ABC transporter ATP-binding protein [Gemmataceae bacterium]|nr:ABC transporter ATP-binding protein [Gemmataceae bacterium]